MDGAGTARTIREELRARAAALPRKPCLAAIMVGDDPASHTYVQMKARQCEAVGIASRVYTLPATALQFEVTRLIDELNADPDVSGILVQHPVPKSLDEPAILSRVAPEKDVDGISTTSLGSLVAERPGFHPATPLGIVTLLDRYGIPIEGKRAVVIGRSVILGKPMALMLLNRHATVTICHSKTRDLAQVAATAEILVAAVGRAEMVTGAWVRSEAVVIDAGYNRVEGRSHDVGDVHFSSAADKAAWITPVPGGVGPMTIAMLLSNTVLAAEHAR